MVGLFQDAVEFERICLPVVFVNLGCCLCGNCRAYSSGHSQIAVMVSKTDWNWIDCSTWNCGTGRLICDCFYNFEDEQAFGENERNSRTDLHRISDELGESIYENVVEVLERREEWKLKVQEASGEVKERMQDVSDEVIDRIAELKKKYREVGGKGLHVSKRLIKAFPRIQSKKYREAMEDLKKHLKRK